jgi:hypothetical protein
MRFHDDAARGYMSFEPLDENSSNFHTHKTVKKFVKFNDDRERSYFFNSFPLFSTELVLIITDGDDPLFFQHCESTFCQVTLITTESPTA